MAKFAKKSSSSPLVLIIPLVIALIVVFSAVVLTRTKTNTESKASFDPLSQCLASCNNRLVKDKAACKLDCEPVIEGTMSCNTFCGDNVRRVAAKPHLKCYTSCPENDDQTILQDFINPSDSNQGCITSCDLKGNEKTSIGICKAQCGSWIDPCTTKMCGKAGQWSDTCTDACNAVKDEEQTCAEAFNQASFSGMVKKQLDVLKMQCVNLFE